MGTARHEEIEVLSEGQIIDPAHGRRFPDSLEAKRLDRDALDVQSRLIKRSDPEAALQVTRLPQAAYFSATRKYPKGNLSAVPDEIRLPHRDRTILSVIH